MKNQSPFNSDVYKAPERPMEISGPALPRWTPPQPLEYYYRLSRGRAPEEITKPVFIPIHLHGTEAIGELFKYTVRVRSAIEVPSYPDVITLNLDEIVGTEVTVHIDIPGRGTFIPGMPGDTGQGNIGFYVREISGVVSDARFVRQDDRAMVYEFDIEPALKKATLGQNWRVFQNCTVIDAIRQLLASYAISVDWRTQGPLHGTHYPVRDLQRQHWEPDWTCFKRWCERAGLFFWFEHSDGFHRLVIADHMGAFRSHGEAYETLRYAPGDSRIDEEQIEQLAFSSQQTAGKATAVDHDYTQPRMRRANAPLRQSEENPRDTAKADQEFYEPANISQPLQGAQGLNGRPLDLDEQARQVALVRQQSMRCQGLRAKGSGHLRALIPGCTFNLTDYPLEKANQEYLVVSATLTIESNDQASSIDQMFRCDTAFELYPVQAGHFRLPIVTPWPVAGTEIAIVTGPEGHEIWTDALGRVLCQVLPDRTGKYDHNSFIWLRVTQPWQNGQMGSAFVPRIGSELLIDYVNGNPDMPYIAGSAVNANNLPAWELPHNQWVSGLRSREREGMASNHLALDDTRGKQQAQLASDYAKSSLSLGYITRIDGNKGRQDERGQGFELRTDLWGALRAAMGLLVTTFGRSGAAGKVKEMGETIARLAQARGQHEDLSQVAQRHNAQTNDASQADAFSTIKVQNDAIRGNGGDTGNGSDFPELTRPDMVFASAAGIATTAADSTHMVSHHDHAITAGRDVSYSAGRSYHVAARSAASLFAYEQGMKFIAAKGAWVAQAQSGPMSLAALGDVTISSTDGKVIITAAKEVWIGAGGSYIQINGSGIVNGSPGPILEKGASWDVPGPDSMTMPLPSLPASENGFNDLYKLINQQTQEPLRNVEYAIVRADGKVEHGVTDNEGHTHLLSRTVTSESVKIYA